MVKSHPIRAALLMVLLFVYLLFAIPIFLIFKIAVLLSSAVLESVWWLADVIDLPRAWLLREIVYARDPWRER